MNIIRSEIWNYVNDYCRICIYNTILELIDECLFYNGESFLFY